MIRKMFMAMSLLALGLFSVQAATVSGTITNNATPAVPIAGAIVTLSSIGGGAAQLDTTDAQGKYSITVSSTNYPAFLSITAATSGYATSAVALVQVASATSTVTHDIQLVAIVTSTLQGKITEDSAKGPGLAGAKVIINRRFGGTYTDTTTTDANGGYEFTGLEATESYSVAATLAGYNGAQANNTQAAGLDTVNLVLVKIITGTLRGKITGDSANGAALVGATVIVSRNGTEIDSAKTDATGWYEIANIPANVQYAVAASMTKYTAKSVNNTQAARADTVSMFLAKIPAGDIYVLVLRRSDSSVVADASVSATAGGGGGGNTFTSTSGATGLAAFETIPTGYYTINITADGFTAGTANQNLAANAKDTVKVYLVVSTVGTKILKGTVTDSTTGQALANVRVVLTLNGGAALTIVDSTDATGAYSIKGIPANRTTGSITASLTGYANRTFNGVTLGTNNTADTTIRNFKMLAVTSVHSSMNALGNAKPAISISRACLLLRNINESGVVSMISANGKIVFSKAISAHTTSVGLPQSKVAAGAYLVNVTQKNGVISKQIIIP